MEEKEEWRTVKGFEGYYEVSNLGRIRAVKRTVHYANGHYQTFKEHLMSLSVSQSGYYRIELSKNNIRKKFFVHDLVAKAFLKQQDSNHTLVHHKNYNKLDERASNLMWVTPSFNVKHGYDYEGVKKTALGKTGKNNKNSMPIIQMSLDGKIVNEFESIIDERRKLGFTTKGIIDCLKGRRNSFMGFKWAYKISPVPNKRVKQILNNKIIKIFPSVTEASKAIHRSKAMIYSVLRGTHKTAGGYFWEYAD